jgi:gamma-glutamyltranspeptidase/glutathione hydrolase
MYIHTLAEAMRGAFADRARIAGDPDIEQGVDAAYAAALEPAALAARRARITPDKTHSPRDFALKDKGTSHLVVADAEGNIVTLTTTVNGPFGAGVVVDGIVLNDQLDDFSEGPNRPRPGARPVSSMTPTIVIEKGEPILAVGGSGGPRIATGVTQATLARLVFDLDPSVCVSTPRFHTEGADLLVDRDIVADVRASLRSRGETVKDEPFETSAVQMVARRNGSWLAASDPRKGGLAAAR